MKLIILQFLYTAVNFSILGPNAPRSTLFTNSLSLSVSLSVLPRPHKNRKFSFLCCISSQQWSHFDSCNTTYYLFQFTVPAQITVPAASQLCYKQCLAILAPRREVQRTVRLSASMASLPLATVFPSDTLWHTLTNPKRFPLPKLTTWSSLTIFTWKEKVDKTGGWW